MAEEEDYSSLPLTERATHKAQFPLRESCLIAVDMEGSISRLRGNGKGICDLNW
jgi:hypothetical protein